MNTRVFPFHAPPFTMGVGARERLPEIVRPLGSRICVITDPGTAAQPGFEDCIRILRNDGLDVRTFTKVIPDPPIQVALDCLGFGREAGADVLMGIGGGSSLDITKITAILLKHSCDVASLFGIGKTPGRGIPTVLVPTTAGTGSEVTPIAILSDEEKKLKRGIVSDDLLASMAVIDPELCVTLPPEPTAYTGMDTLTHAIEVYTNKFAVPLIDAFALRAIHLVAQNLRRCVADGEDVEARCGMSEASLLGGLCLGPVNTAAVHALAYPLGGTFHVPHGVANSLLLPHVMKFNAPVSEKRYAEIAKAFSSEDALASVQELSQAIGTARKMREFGVQPDDLPVMANAAMDVQRLLVNNPREVTEADALAIYEEAW